VVIVRNDSGPNALHSLRLLEREFSRLNFLVLAHSRLDTYVLHESDTDRALASAAKGVSVWMTYVFAADRGDLVV